MLFRPSLPFSCWDFDLWGLWEMRKGRRQGWSLRWDSSLISLLCRDRSWVSLRHAWFRTLPARTVRASSFGFWMFLSGPCCLFGLCTTPLLISDTITRNESKTPEGMTLRGYWGVALSSLSLLLPARRRAASLPLPPYRPWDPSPRTKRFWTESPGTINQNKPLFSLTGSMQFVSALDSWHTQRRGAHTSPSDWGKRIWWRKTAVCMA